MGTLALGKDRVQRIGPGHRLMTIEEYLSLLSVNGMQGFGLTRLRGMIDNRENVAVKRK